MTPTLSTTLDRARRLLYVAARMMPRYGEAAIITEAAAAEVSRAILAEPVSRDETLNALADAQAIIVSAAMVGGMERGALSHLMRAFSAIAEARALVAQEARQPV